MRHAVLDIGSNTIRLLVAEVDGEHLTAVLDDSDFVRLGKGVDSSGALQPDRMEAGIGSIRRMSAEARENGAESLVAIATSAMRDASNGQEYAARIREETGVDVEIISGQREAELTFRGATLDVDVEAGVLVCDLGGGSAELISADRSGILWDTSEGLGSGRLTERFVEHDPPRAEELDALRRYVEDVLAGLPGARPRTIVFTGGTATHVALVSGSDRASTDLDRATLEQVLRSVISQRADLIASAYKFQLERAQVLPAGAAALATIAAYYDPERILITRQGIREGALLQR